MESQLEVSAFPVGELRFYHRNPRRGDVRAIAASLETRGQYRPIVVNVGSLTGRPLEVLAGNHTLAAARSLGWESVQATTVDVDDEGAAQIVLADNRLADLGGYDDADLLEVLRSAGDLAGTGYTDRDLAILVRDLDEPVGLTDPDDIPDLGDGDAVSALGDVWELGPHRLVVGDAGDVPAIRAACDHELVDAVWTDPPYGVAYVGSAGKTLMNDATSSEAGEVVRAACATIMDVCRPGAPVYVAHPEQGRDVFLSAIRGSGLIYRQTLVWVKDSLVLSRSDYHYRHEPVLEAAVPVTEDDEEYGVIGYGFVPGADGRLGRGGHRWYGDNKSSTVFDVARPKASKAHPTMKPVELVERMLRNSCPPGGLVLDLFAGSGSTMIACHRLGLRAVLVELDPVYADVICQRWQEHTGIAPVRAGESVSFVGG